MSEASGVRGIVLIHGRGADGVSMRPLLPALGLEGAAVAAPDAPGRSWWPTSFLAPMAQMTGPLAAGLDVVDGAVESLGVPRSTVALVGFSQGACLALEYAARRGQGLGAVIAFSGGLVGTADVEGEIYGHGEKAFDYATDLSGLQAVVTCHAADPHVPLKRARDSVDVLRALGTGAHLVAHPGPGHQPMPEGIAAARAALDAAG